MTTDELKTILEIQNFPFECYNRDGRKETFFCFPAKTFRKCEIIFDEEKNHLEYTDNKRYLRQYYDFAKEGKDDILELIDELYYMLSFAMERTEVAE